ncbi:hypothetical protein A2165_00110 [Candidatus Curtissbacteria bacterium RBG_13_40_7]|uniref:Uncharacterized protein n=1 Tax=Candidatus Curtissbacteria bacterium RBG_13_40_7 TaxID=1797706 RepID=A0A1F5FXL4_9BACT|nr:MAG: hypothetical protein A2165_00110 [Candidatus Curtissbacteria bacterium RBG_13_40_7]
MTIEADHCIGCLYLTKRNGTYICLPNFTPLKDKQVCQNDGPVVKMPQTHEELRQLAMRLSKNGGRLKSKA